MSLADIRTKIGQVWTVLNLTSKATALNMKVLYLQFRLWRANSALDGFDTAIQDAMDRMHEACQRDASLAFERILDEISVDSLGLQPVIVQALHWDDVHTLKGVGKRLYDLESIPNIGPMRSQMIEKAYARRLDKAALQACHTILMIEEVRTYLAFKDSVTATMQQYDDRLQQLRARAGAYYAEIGDYLDTPDYRKEAYKTASHLTLDVNQFMQEMSEAIKTAKKGQATVVLMDRNGREFQSMAAEILGEITFKLSYGHFRQIEVQDGEIVND